MQIAFELRTDEPMKSKLHGKKRNKCGILSYKWSGMLVDYFYLNVLSNDLEKI